MSGQRKCRVAMVPGTWYIISVRTGMAVCVYYEFILVVPVVAIAL